MKDWSKAEWVDPKFNWEPAPVSELPPRVLIDFATKCNLRCHMCPVWGLEDEKAIDSVEGVMPLERARRLLDELAAAKPLIHPCLYGEPLLAPNIKDHIRQAKSHGMPFAMNTNGLALTQELAEYIVAQKVDSVMVSIDATTPETLKKIRGIRKIERIERAVFLLLKVRGEREFPRIGVSFTVQDANRHELAAFVKRWVGVVDVVRTGLVFEEGKFTELQAPKKRTPCPVLYKTLPVHNDGTVTVCCLDGLRSTNMGNVFEAGVGGVWNGEAFAKMRYYHETEQWDKTGFCKGCNGWAQYEYEEEVRDGLLIRRSPEFTYYNKIARLGNWQGKLLGGHAAPPEGLVERRAA
jgi:MoaA/NifB/PqqE/SkfB family radical SAM enzyme